jgi:acetolactate synthase-1/2/3 large subunit
MRQDQRQLTVGALLAARLRAHGVQRVYGFPGGGSNLDLFEELVEAGIAVTLTHTENGAAFMAAAGAEIERVPGVVVVGNGPGLASVADGVAHAWLDRVPLLVISDRYSEGEAATTGHQVIDQRALLEPITKAGMTLRPAGAAAANDELLAIASSFPQGPVHIDMARSAAAEPSAELEAAGAAPPAPAAAADQARLGDFAAQLARAERPLLLVGLEANEGVSPQRLRELAHRAGAAVLTTYKAKGVYPERDPRWAGIFTGAEIERPLLEQADLILAVASTRSSCSASPGPTAPRC